MKLLLDNIIFSLQKAGGISTYWGELSKRLMRDHEDVCFVENHNENLVRKTISIDQSKILADLPFPQLINRFLPLPLSKQKEIFLFHSSYNRITTNKKAIQIVTVHDFVHELFYKGLRQKLHSYQKGRAIDKAEMIICVSENTKSDLMKLHPKVAEKKIQVIYNGASDDFYRIESVRSDSRPYLVFIGSREPYKNFDFVVKLLKELKDFDLAIVGKPLGKAENEFVVRSLGNRFSIFSHIDNPNLNKLYNGAFALLYPSSYEGFGIPILESMKTGLPFIGLNKSSIPEVAGEAGILLDGLDIDLFKNAILNLDSKRSSLVEKGIHQASTFSWEKCYQETLNLYKKLH